MPVFHRFLNRLRLRRNHHPLPDSDSASLTSTRAVRGGSSTTTSSEAINLGGLSATNNMAELSTASDMVELSTGSDMADLSTANDTADLPTANDMAESLPTVDMAELLTEQQLEALGDTKVGDLIFVVKKVTRADEDDMSASDVDEDDSEDEDEGEGEDDEDDEKEEEDAAEDEADEEDEEDENEDDDSNSDDTADPANVPTPPRMFLVTAVICDDEENVQDIKVERMIYSKTVSANEPHTYQVYGDQLVHHHSAIKCNTCKDAVSITTVLTDSTFTPHKSPNGDYVRRKDPTISTNATHRCTTGCEDGWLIDRQMVNSMFASQALPVLTWEGNPDQVPMQATICPICIGLDLFNEQRRLQYTLLTDGRVDLELVISHEGRLNLRRAFLTYRFRQFDERLWGMYFDDMDGEEGEDGIEANWDDPYENFPEALDPNAYIRLHPASEATIQALPRRLFGDTGSDAAKCGVCMDQLKQDSVVIELPCGHAEHHAECLEMWLRQQETCTVCRRVVPTAKVVVQPAIEEDEQSSEEGVSIASETGPVGDLHPNILYPGQHGAIAHNAPALLPSSSWVTVDDDVVMSDD